MSDKLITLAKILCVIMAWMMLSSSGLLG
ncbi:hypothetical protein ACSP9X_004784 [Escherichia coli]